VLDTALAYYQILRGGGFTMSNGDAGWQTAGCTGFGARLLVELAVHFSAPTP